MTTSNSVPNRLVTEKSPYLLQHAYNPVDWHPWNSEAFEKAKLDDKLIFLSIGYSTCHWCHVMERESFEDKDVAKILNERYVSIKVDREERPDIDAIYMSACQIMTGSGGWPLSVFITPEGQPFYAGTYFPKNRKYGRIGFVELLMEISYLWNSDRKAVVDSAQNITGVLSGYSEDTNIEGNNNLTTEINSQEAFKALEEKAFKQLQSSYDSQYGGFGIAPKFPTPHNILFLLRYWHLYKDGSALSMAENTLTSMYRGGIFDHIGFGFSRYSTDQKWLIPHFEKMLYDNALLLMAYTEGYLATNNNICKKAAIKTADFLIRDMKSPEGGFYSALDADSEGVEGKFYIWSREEIEALLGLEKAEIFCREYDITPQGNFEGKNIPNRINSSISALENDTFEEERIRLYNHRNTRIHPFRDDKIITSWNGLAIAALSKAGKVFDNQDYIDAAKNCADFLLSKMLRKDGRLFSRYREGEAGILGYLDDYAFLVWGLIELYEATFREEYIKRSEILATDMLELFLNDKKNAFHLYGKDSEKLIARTIELYDGAMPSGNSVSAMILSRLSLFTESGRLENNLPNIINNLYVKSNQSPLSHLFAITALMCRQPNLSTAALKGSLNTIDAKNMLDLLSQKYLPFLHVKYEEDSTSGNATVQICRDYSCKPLIHNVKELKDAIESTISSYS